MGSRRQEYDLAGQVIGLAMKVHSALGPGFLESVYQNAVSYELAEAGYEVEQEKSITVKYCGHTVGEFAADMLVDGLLMVREAGRSHEKKCDHQNDVDHRRQVRPLRLVISCRW